VASFALKAEIEKQKFTQAFKEACTDELNFLTEKYGFVLAELGEDPGGLSAIYTNATTALKVSFERHENHIFVYVIKLKNGKIPLYLEYPENWDYAEGLLSILAPNLKLRQKELGDWLTPQDMKEVIRDYAKALAKYGHDVFSGDFSIFDKAVKELRASLPKH
jgi:hypothetical protein